MVHIRRVWVRLPNGVPTTIKISPDDIVDDFKSLVADKFLNNIKLKYDAPDINILISQDAETQIRIEKNSNLAKNIVSPLLPDENLFNIIDILFPTGMKPSQAFLIQLPQQNNQTQNPLQFSSPISFQPINPNITETQNAFPYSQNPQQPYFTPINDTSLHIGNDSLNRIQTQNHAVPSQVIQTHVLPTQIISNQPNLNQSNSNQNNIPSTKLLNINESAIIDDESDIQQNQPINQNNPSQLHTHQIPTIIPQFDTVNNLNTQNNATHTMNNESHSPIDYFKYKSPFFNKLPSSHKITNDANNKTQSVDNLLHNADPNIDKQILSLIPPLILSRRPSLDQENVQNENQNQDQNQNQNQNHNQNHNQNQNLSSSPNLNTNINSNSNLSPNLIPNINLNSNNNSPNEQHSNIMSANCLPEIGFTISQQRQPLPFALRRQPDEGYGTPSQLFNQSLILLSEQPQFLSQQPVPLQQTQSQQIPILLTAPNYYLTANYNKSNANNDLNKTTNNDSLDGKSAAETPSIQENPSSASISQYIAHEMASILEAIVPPIKVLIVEDNIINQKILEEFMRKRHISCDVAKNGREALDKWRAGGYHLVLMDIQLPVMSGIEVTREIRRLEHVNRIGVFRETSTPPVQSFTSSYSSPSPQTTQTPQFKVLNQEQEQEQKQQKQNRQRSNSSGKKLDNKNIFKNELKNIKDKNNLKSELKNTKDKDLHKGKLKNSKVENDMEDKLGNNPTFQKLNEDYLPSSLFRSPIIIVALTASSLQSDKEVALAAGCNDFLTKPVSLVWLDKKITEWGCMQALVDFEGWKTWKTRDGTHGSRKG